MLLTYFIATIFYFISSEFNSKEDVASGKNFNAHFKLDQLETDNMRLNRVLYFALTILSTVGYGDFKPISNLEMISVCIFMIIGVFLFTFIMSMFDNMVKSYQKNMG